MPLDISDRLLQVLSGAILVRLEFEQETVPLWVRGAGMSGMT